MGELSSKFSRDDIETMLEAIGDWEMLGNQEFHVLQMIKNAPLPPDDHEAHEAMQNIKDHFKRREKDIMRSREVRQERSIFLKAKLMLVRKDIGISQLFDMAASVDPNSTLTPKEESESSGFEGEGGVTEPKAKSKDTVASLRKKLELAEFFIDDLGVKSHYEKFLADKSGEEKPAE